MIEIIAFLLPAVLATAIYVSLDTIKLKASSPYTIISSLGLFSWFAISNNLMIFILLQYGFGHVSTPVGPNLFNVSFTWKFLAVSLVIATMNALVTHELLKNISIKTKKN